MRDEAVPVTENRLKKNPDFSGLPEDKALRLLVEEKLQVQCDHTLAYPFVRDAIKNNELLVHMVVYDLATGQLKKIEE